MKGNRKREAEGVSSKNSSLGARNEEFLWGSFSDLSPLLILPPRLPSGDCVCFCTLNVRFGVSRICRQAFTAIAIWRSTCPALLCCTGFFAASSPFSFCYSECFFGIPCSSSATKAFRRHDSTMFGKKNFRNSVQGCLCFLWRLLFHFAFIRLVKLEELFSFPIFALFEEGEILEKNICLGDKRKGGGKKEGGFFSWKRRGKD